MPTQPTPRVRRPSLWLLAVPAVLYLLAPVVANRIEPRILGLPFLVFYMVVVTVLTSVGIGLTARFDPLFRDNADEPVPADRAFGTEEAIDK